MKLGLVIFAWIARNALALLVIVLILLVARHAAGPAAEWLGVQSHALRTVPAQQAAYAEASRGFEVYASRRRAEAREAAAALARSSEEHLRARRQALGPQIARLEAAQLSTPQLAQAAARGDSDALLGHYREEAEVALLDLERRQIEALLSARSAERESLSLQAQRRAAARQLTASHRDWLSARRRVDELEGRFLAGPRNTFCRLSPLGVGCENYRALVAARRQMEAAAARNSAARARIALLTEAERALAAAGETIESADAVLARQRGALSEEVRRLDQTARDNLAIRAWRAVGDVLAPALLILAAAILAPILMKALLFFGVAPRAARRPPIRLLEAEAGEVRLLAASAVSQRVPLAPGEELLVLPEAVQSTPHHAAKRTQWLLSLAMPLSSIASGMVALTRIRVERPDTILVSATGGPLAEIALIRLERGSALVLRPRALRGLLQTPTEPVRITRHWRFGLSAWLTLQFRYLIFHGPGAFLIEGARGVRLERAGSGRGINQAATIGFSAGLAYAVSRSETFGAYLLGKQALFNDSFQSAEGFYLYEEMPMETGKGSIWGGGLRGLGDAILKVVGL
ncbi:MAG TPA: hypothetical protein VD906_14710 [Caulobacteraceae bacterium]|nr:hypothetical protein [Caulobacteraceae bacterium]